MLRPTAIKVSPKPGFYLIVEFDSGERKQFDVNPYIKGEWYGELSDPSYFNAAFVNGYTVEWPHGQDICPDELYYSGTAI